MQDQKAMGRRSSLRTLSDLWQPFGLEHIVNERTDLDLIAHAEHIDRRRFQTRQLCGKQGKQRQPAQCKFAPAESAFRRIRIWFIISLARKGFWRIWKSCSSQVIWALPGSSAPDMMMTGRPGAISRRRIPRAP